MSDPETLAIALSCAVPLWLDRVRALSPEERAARAVACSRVISLGEKNDELRGQHGCGPALLACGEQPRGSNLGAPAAVFNALAEGLALAALLPGGVTYLGHRWEA